MPVKVKCASCAKIFAAPDAARGKLVKCPGCEGKVKVPAGDGAKPATAPAKSTAAPAKPPAKKKVPPKDADHDEQEHAIKNLDLDTIEDENANICPKCGQEIYEEETIECPTCGLNFETGQTKDKQRGVDPKLFFRYAWKDPLKFMKSHRRFVIRTSLYTLVYSLLFLLSFLMIGICSDPPPRAFWTLIAVVTAMVPPGWLFFLNGEVIKLTMEKKDQLGRINFDMYTCMALGFKTYLWTAAMGAQFVLPVAGAVMIKMGQLIPGAVLIGVGLIPILLVMPQAMVHMTMPITRRAWMMHIHLMCWGKAFLASAYWCVITLVVLLPALLPVAILGGIGARKTATFAGMYVRNYTANSAYYADTQAVEAAKNNPKGPQPTFNKDDPKYKNEKLPFMNLILPAIGLVLSEMLVGFGAVFAMRVNGLLGLYYKKHLKLESMAKEVKYITKKDLEDDPALKKKMDQQKMIKNIAVLIGLLTVLGGLGWYQFLRKPPVEAPPAQDGGAAPAANAAPGGAQPGMPGMNPGAAPGAVPMP